MRHEIEMLADGWAGTDRTIEKMDSLADSGLTDPLVVTTAQNLVRHLPERDKLAEVQAISNYVRGKVRYTNEGVETLKSPRLMMNEIKKYGKAVGDCDDHVILWAAMHRALGNPVRFKVVSQKRDRTGGHVYGEVYARGTGWIADDLIVKHKPLGWSIPERERTRTKTYQSRRNLSGYKYGASKMRNVAVPRRYISVLPVGPSEYFEKGSTQMMYATRTYPEIRVPGQAAFYAEAYGAQGLGQVYDPRYGWVVDPKKTTTGNSLASTIKDIGTLVSTSIGVYGTYRDQKKAKEAAEKARKLAAAKAAADQRQFLQGLPVSSGVQQISTGTLIPGVPNIALMIGAAAIVGFIVLKKVM